MLIVFYFIFSQGRSPATMVGDVGDLRHFDNKKFWTGTRSGEDIGRTRWISEKDAIRVMCREGKK